MNTKSGWQFKSLELNHTFIFIIIITNLTFIIYLTKTTYYV